MCRRRPIRPTDFQLVQVSQVNSNKQAPATLQSVEYRCQIINNILKTTMTQVFVSKSENEYSETIYLFPIEDDVCLESFQAKFNENTIKGIVKSKEDADKEYEEHKEQGNFVSYASIQKTPKEEQVKIKLGNLPPNQQVEIVLTFSSQLQSLLNKYYVANIPIQYFEDEISAKMGKNVLTLDLFCTGKISYANSKGYPAEKVVVDENTTRFTLSQAFLQKDVDFQLIYSYEGMFDPQVILGSSKIYNEDKVKSNLLPVSHSAMISFIPNFNKEITTELDDTIRAAIMNGDDILSDEFQQKLNQELVDHLNSSRSEFIFLLDRSGSMSGKPIQKAVEALTLFLKSLPNDSYFNVVSFGSSFQKLFPSSSKYTSQTLSSAASTIKNYSADLGGTEIYQPLVNIFQNSERIKGYNRQIYLLTDGAVSQPENVVNLIKKNNKFNRVHSIGFGSGADKFLIEQSAISGKGISNIIDLNSDLSEVILNMLSNSITPTFDDFSISYDKTVFDSSHPSSTDFPCVFKDEIINIHFFFKPLMDISSLNDAQKMISIEYYDSQAKQRVKKDIRLEMSDCFTCNGELQESVFKLGKQLYLNETIPKQGNNNANDLLQQALDFQLLTEKTALICLIETLNDEQKIMYQHIKHNVQYSNTNASDERQYKDKSMPMPRQSSARGGGMYSVQSGQQQLIQAEKKQSGGIFSSIASFFTSSKKSKSSAPSQSISMSQPQELRSGSSISSSYSMKASVQNSAPSSTLQRRSVDQEKKKMKKSKKEQTREREQIEEMCDNYCDDEDDCEFEPQSKQMNMCSTSASYTSPPSAPIQLQQQQQQQQQQQLFSKQCVQEEIKGKSGSKSDQLSSLPIQSGSYKLEDLLNLVDNLGIWSYDEKLIQRLTNKLNSEKTQELAQHFTKTEFFMTLLILCILELQHSQNKSKWILISKKSTSCLKSNMKEGEDFNSLKQQIIQILQN